MQEETLIARTRRIGGSLMITIPAEIVKQEQLEENQAVNITIKKRKMDGFGILKGIGSYNREEDRMKDR